VAPVTSSYHTDHTEKLLIYKTRPGYESRNRCSFSRFLKMIGFQFSVNCMLPTTTNLYLIISESETLSMATEFTVWQRSATRQSRPPPHRALSEAAIVSKELVLQTTLVGLTTRPSTSVINTPLFLSGPTNSACSGDGWLHFEATQYTYTAGRSVGS